VAFPGDVVAENVRDLGKGVHSLFESFDVFRDTIGLELNRGIESDSFDLKVTKTDLYGRKSVVEKSSVVGGENDAFVDFGCGLSFSVVGGAIRLNPFVCGCSGYFKTDADLIISEFMAGNNFMASAKSITVEERLFSNVSLTLLTHSMKNLGIISSPKLEVKANDILNGGNMSAKTLSLSAKESIVNENEGSMIGVDLLHMSAPNISCDNASLRSKKLRVNAKKINLENGSYVKSDSTFGFVGDELHLGDGSVFQTNDDIKILARSVYNEGGRLLSKNKIDINSNMLFNGGEIVSKKVEAYASSEGYEYADFDRRFGSIANVGVIKADVLSLVVEKHLFNKKHMVARDKIRLSAVGKFINSGTVRQLGYSQDFSTEINATDGVYNENGEIHAGGGLSLTGKFFDNSKGILKARQMRMQFALDGERNFTENKREELYLQAERNPHSKKFEEFTKVARSTSIPASQSEQQKQEPKDESGNDEAKKVPPEIGFLVNTGGIIESDRDIEIKSSGAIYNAERGMISAKETIKMDIFGRLLNQLGGVISASSAIVKSSGKIFNTLGAKMLGSFEFESNGFENGLGSSIRGGLMIKSATSILNFGEIQTLENPLSLSTDLTIKNYGIINSSASLELNAKEELVNDGGKITAPAIDAQKTKRIFNKKGGTIEAKIGDVIFADGVALSNEGWISSNDLRLTKLIPAIPGNREINRDGVLDARRSFFLSCDDPLAHINGIMSAPEFVFENASLGTIDSAKNTSYGTIDFAKLLKDSALKTQKATFRFPNAKLENKNKTILAFDTQISAKEFQNLSILHGTKDLKIHSNQNFVNGLDHLYYEPFFSLGSDYDIAHKPELNGILKKVSVDLAPERKLEKTIISSGGNLVLESQVSIKNTGSIRSDKRLSFKAPRVQHGWAHESVRHESLPTLNFNYDHMESQPSYVAAEDGMSIDAAEFLNTFGIIDVKGGLTSTNGKIFLNYGGAIDVRGNATVKSPLFANLIGTVKTNRADQRYWSIEFCNTDAPTFNVFGTFAINSPQAINAGGHLFGQNGILLEGKQTNGLQAVVDISSKGFGYNRMYSVNECNKGSYSDKILGMSLAGTGHGAIVRAELNETVQKSVLPASVTAQKQVVINGYANLKSTGIIHGGAVHIKTGAGITELGYTGDAILPSISGFAKTVELFPYVSSLSENKMLDLAEATGDFFFKSSGISKIPFTIIASGTENMATMKLPFSVDVMETIMTKRLQSAIGTGYVPDMSTFLDAAKKSRTSKILRQSESSAFPHLKKYTDDRISIVSPEEARHGLFFRPQKLGHHWLLFPELHLSPNSVHAALGNPAGATVAQGKENANVIIDTEGFLHATASLHADDDIRVKAARGALFETTTYDAWAVTQNMFATSRRSGIFGGKKTEVHKVTEWHQIKRAREPMLITTTRGDFIMVIPDDQQSEFHGALADVGGNFEVSGEKFTLSPLEVAGVVECQQIGNASRISTMLPIFHRTVINSRKDFHVDVRVFKNTAGVINALGNVVIKADEAEFETLLRHVTVAEGSSVHGGGGGLFGTTTTTQERVEQPVFTAPETTAGGDIKFQTGTANLTGKFKAKKNIDIKSRIATLKSLLAYGTHEFQSNASNFFGSASFYDYSTQAFVSPTTFESECDFLADIADSYFEQSLRKYCRNEIIHAAKINISPLEAHEIRRTIGSSSGFKMFVPTPVYGSMANGDIDKIIHEFWNQSALVNSTQSLLHSKRGADLAVSGVSTALAAYSTLSTVLQHGLGGVLSTFGIGDLGWSSTTSRTSITHDFTVASETHATGNVELYARTGDLNIRHRLAEAAGDQRYIAAGSIFVAPGEDKITVDQTTKSSGVNFNVFTLDLSANFSNSSSSSSSIHQEASSFKSGGTNIFRAGNGISIVIPQIEGSRNVFDAMVVNLENKADEESSSSSSSGFGISTNLAQMAAATASLNIGNSGSRNTFLHNAFIRGATDFMHSKVLNQGCNVMNITGQGASYQYVPLDEIHSSHNFAIGLSGLDLSSPDAFAYTLGRGLLSAAASGAVGMLASEAGLGGFVSSLAASLTGAYVNSEIMPQRNFSGDPHRTPSGLSSNSSIEIQHNGRGFKAVNVDFNAAAFRETINEVKARIFDECLDQNIPVEVATEIVEDQIEDFKEEVSELVKEAEELQKSPEEPVLQVQSVEIQQPIVTESDQGQQSRLENVALFLQTMNADASTPQNQSEAEVMPAFREVSLGGVELTPRQKVEMYEPKNAYEAKVKDLTIFKHKVLDFMERHPEAAEMGMKLLSGVAQGWQAIKYAGATIGGFVGGGPVGSVAAVSSVYATQTASEVAIDTTVTATSNSLAANITGDNVLQKEFAGTIKICELGLLCAGSAKAVKALKGTLKAQTTKLTTPKVSLNSNQYVGECKLYEIYRVSDRKPVKIGETARGYNGQGRLIRPQEQCNVFEKRFGEKFDYDVLGTFGSKAEVRAIETRTILERRAIDPNALPLNKGIH
jgi:adhesin HecA-like repeat protein